jgi:hypothetical protein
MGKKTKKIIKKNNNELEKGQNIIPIPIPNYTDGFIEEEIRQPIPSYTDRLVEEEPYNIFEEMILSNDNMDEDLRHVMLESRKEYLDKHAKKNNEEQNILNKINKNKILLDELINVINLLSNIQIKNRLKSRINRYINLESENIILEFDIYDEMIEHINNNYKSENKEDILKLFICDNEEERLNYLNLLELSKKTYEEEEKQKKEKEEIEKQKILELNRRNELFLKINLKLSSLSIFDKNILELKNKINPKIRDFIDGKSYTLNNNKGNIIPSEYKKVYSGMGLTREGHKGNMIIHFHVNFPTNLTNEQIDKLIDIL